MSEARKTRKVRAQIVIRGVADSAMLIFLSYNKFKLTRTMVADTRANFNYTVDTGVSPEIYFYDTPLSAGLRAPGDDPHEMTIRDGWSRASSFSLDREGFALRDFSSPFDRWDEGPAIRTKANAQQQTTEQNTT
jgi:hypothetical protein